MDVRGQRPPKVVVVSQDIELLDQILTAAAAAGVEPLAVDAVSVRSVWTAAATIVVGVDQAAELASMVLPHRPEVFVVGEDTLHDEVCAWSLPLGAAVVLLPSGAHRLAMALADASEPGGGRGRLVTVVAGSGGVGASTCAAALAFVGAQRGLKTILVDGAPWVGALTC